MVEHRWVGEDGDRDRRHCQSLKIVDVWMNWEERFLGREDAIRVRKKNFFKDHWRCYLWPMWNLQWNVMIKNNLIR